MGFFPFVPQSVPVTGGTFSGPVTITGLLTTQLGITNSGAVISSSTAVQGAGVASTGVSVVTGGGGLNAGVGSVDVPQVGGGLKVAEGSNAKQGLTAAMVAGTTTVANTSVTASSRILLTSQATGGTVGGENVSARTAGTSFTITSTNAADTSQVGFQIFEPG